MVKKKKIINKIEIYVLAYVRHKKYNYQLTTLVILNILYLEQLMNDSHDEGPFYVAYSHHLRDFKNHSELKYDLPLICIF